MGGVTIMYRQGRQTELRRDDLTAATRGETLPANAMFQQNYFGRVGEMPCGLLHDLQPKDDMRRDSK